MKKYFVKSPMATCSTATIKSNMHHIISATEASRSLSDILNKVCYQKQSFNIKRGKKIIAQIIPNDTTMNGVSMPVQELNEFFKNLPHLESNDLDDFENVLKEIRMNSIIDENDLWD